MAVQLTRVPYVERHVRHTDNNDTATQRQNECACSADLARFVIPVWMKFAEQRTKHRYTHFRTDIDVIRPEN